MKIELQRESFSRSWGALLLFLALVTLPTFWGLLGIQSETQAALGTILASAVVGLIGWWFLRREGVSAAEVGLGRRAWREGVLLFFAWWVTTSLADLIARWIAARMGQPLAPMGAYEWSLGSALLLLGQALAVGFGEEIAFRGYLHNKLAALLERRWLAVGLAALIFGLWHTPADIAMRGELVAPLLNAGVFFLFGLLFFHLPYAWSGLLPFLALLHGWNDFPVMLTAQAPTVPGVIAGYVLVWVALWIYRRLGSARGRAP